MGNWFSGLDRDGKRTEAKNHAAKKNLYAWEIQYKRDGYTVFYVGEKLTKRTEQEMQRGEIHVLRIWYPEGKSNG